MKTIAFIPVRGGSKSIPLKNIKLFCGKPLVCWNIEALENCSLVDEIVIATDSDEIECAVVAQSYKKTVIYRRLAENASDTATTESVMLEYIKLAKLNELDVFMLVQATSPLTGTLHFTEALSIYKQGKYDSMLTCVRNYRFFWNEDGTPLNYDYHKRPRRQNFSGMLMENGAFYINTIKNILEKGNRLSGNIGIYEMPEYTAFEVSDELLQDAISNYDFVCTSDINRIRGCNFYVVAVPTPVDANNRPDLTPLWRASETVGKVISKGDIVVYESTVYPGVTEEECLPVVERVSGLKFNKDFFAGYSPERINPGDKEHTVEKIKKVTSGSTPEIADIVDNVYNSVLVNGTHKAPSIKVAEASKIIENSQRDVNIAFMNELAKIFNAMGIDTNDVIEAASSKWNFIKLKPGLVGGHCISVDPYYLIQKAQVYGVLPRVMFSARRLNDGMGDYVGNQVIKLMNKKGVLVKDSNVLILGFTFKENCPDVRNTKIVDIYHTLEEYTKNITVYDPWANADKVEHEYGVQLTSSSLESLKGKFNAVILAVAHKEFVSLDIRSFLKNENGVVYDVKGILDREMIDGRL